MHSFQLFCVGPQGLVITKTARKAGALCVYLYTLEGRWHMSHLLIEYLLINENNYLGGLLYLSHTFPLCIYFPRERCTVEEMLLASSSLYCSTPLCGQWCVVRSLAPNLSSHVCLISLQCRLLCRQALLMDCFVLCPRGSFPRECSLLAVVDFPLVFPSPIINLSCVCPVSLPSLSSSSQCTAF